MEQYLRTGSIRSTGAVSRQTEPLSYLSSKCVLEHLEVNTRLLLVSHCPSLHNQHMGVPLKIQYLKMECDKIHINNFTHFFLPAFRDSDNSQFVRYSVRFKDQFYPLFDSTGPYEPIRNMQKFMEKFTLKGHTPMVSEFHISWCPDEGNLVKFRVSELRIVKSLRGNFITPEHIRSLVDPKSLPVRKMLVEVENENDPLFQKDYSEIAVFLEIRSDHGIYNLPLFRIRSKYVKLSFSYISADILAQLAQSWMETSREVGTKYMFETLTYQWGYLKRLSTAVAILTGIHPIQDTLGNESYRFKMDESKELKIYQEEPCVFIAMEIVEIGPNSSF